MENEIIYYNCKIIEGIFKMKEYINPFEKEQKEKEGKIKKDQDHLRGRLRKKCGWQTTQYGLSSEEPVQKPSRQRANHPFYGWL